MINSTPSVIAMFCGLLDTGAQTDLHGFKSSHIYQFFVMIIGFAFKGT